MDDLDHVQNTRRPGIQNIPQSAPILPAFWLQKSVDYMPCSVFIEGRWQSKTLWLSYLFKFWNKAVHFERVP